MKRAGDERKPRQRTACPIGACQSPGKKMNAAKTIGQVLVCRAGSCRAAASHNFVAEEKPKEKTEQVMCRDRPKMDASNTSHLTGKSGFTSGRFNADCYCCHRNHHITHQIAAKWSKHFFRFILSGLQEAAVVRFAPCVSSLCSGDVDQGPGHCLCR